MTQMRVWERTSSNCTDWTEVKLLEGGVDVEIGNVATYTA